MTDYRDISWSDTVDQPACDAGIDNYKTVSRDPERSGAPKAKLKSAPKKNAPSLRVL